MLTIQQAQQYLSSIGLAPPEPIIMAWLDQFNKLQDCLDGAGYSGATQSLILSYLIGLFGLSGVAALVLALVLVGIALMATGAMVGVLSGTSPLKRALRQLAIGFGAAAVTYVLGLVFGVSVA